MRRIQALERPSKIGRNRIVFGILLIPHRRQSIILPDDPNFDPFANIPSLDLLLTAVEHRIGPSQGSSGGYSQLSPPDLSQVLLQPMGRSSEQTPSSRSAGSRYISIGSVQDLDPFSKSAHQAESRMDLDLLDDEQTPAIDFGLEIDEDGMWRMADGSDADLPALPGLAASRPSTGANMQDPMNMQDEEMLLVDGDGLILEEPVLPEAEAFPDHAQQASNGVSATTSEETGRASAKHKRVYRRKAKQPLTLDHEDKISRNEFRNWSQNYARNMEARRQHPKGVTPARAKQNAWNLISGYGVSAVGRLGVHDGSAHPLASFFAGDALEALLEGRDPAEILKKETMTTGRRRTSDEAFGEEEDGDESRRVKARTDEIGRNLQHDDDDMLMLDNDEAPEMGRDPGSAMTDRHSSTVMPWIRPGSVVQISSARRAGSAQRLGTPSSPLRRLAKLAPINRHSDPPVALSDDLHIHRFSHSVLRHIAQDLLALCVKCGQPVQVVRIGFREELMQGAVVRKLGDVKIIRKCNGRITVTINWSEFSKAPQGT